MKLGKSLSRQLLEFSVSIVVVALLLNWAWQLLAPLLPVLILVSAAGGVLMSYRRRRW